MWQVVDAYPAYPLEERHKILGFDCGDKEINNWIRKKAWQAHSRFSARSFVATGVDRETVVAFYTLRIVSEAIKVLRGSGLNKDWADNAGQFHTVELLYLAVDKRFAGIGIGTGLLVHAIDKAWGVAKEVGSYGMSVGYANDGLQRFYSKFGFKPYATGSNRMLLPIETIEALMGTDPS